MLPALAAASRAMRRGIGASRSSRPWRGAISARGWLLQRPSQSGSLAFEVRVRGAFSTPAVSP